MRPVLTRSCVLALHLPRGLVHSHMDAHVFRTAAPPCPANRGRPKVIEPDGDPDMSLRRADAVGRIERDPADARHVGFSPRVAGVLLRYAIRAMEIAADITRRNVEMPRGRNEDMCEVLAHAAL